ncbi:MAG: hypothetical protein IEMM0008_1851 [bacterium]|nr:MAG: hypothetical protein IEMM0008_1851 [bacterium]
MIALYQQYLDEGKAFIPRLKGFLRTGGGMNPVEITKQLGVDIRNPDFWRKSIVYIEGLVNELENLVLKDSK